MHGQLRRVGLILSLLAVCFFMQPDRHAPAADRDNVPADEQTIIVGPFEFVEVCENSDGFDKDGGFVAECARKTGVQQGVIRQALGECKLWIIDKKKKTSEGWKFTGDARIVAEGKFAFELQNKKEKDFRIQLEACEFKQGRTDNSVSPATREGFIQCQFSAQGELKIGRAFASARLSYDVNGKTEGIQKQDDNEKKVQAEYRKQIVGTWECTDSDEREPLPVGSVFEFWKDGKYKMSFMHDGVKVTMEGPYELTGDKLSLDEKGETKLTIEKLNDTELVTANEGGRTCGWKRKKGS